MEHNTIKGAILDLDGTLLDSMNVWHSIDIELVKKYNIDSPELISKMAKEMTINEFAEFFVNTFSLPTAPTDIINEIEQMMAYKYETSIPLKDGAEEFLIGLDKMGIKYGIATATYPALAKAAIDRLGLDSKIQFMLTESELNTSKNEPYIYYEGAKHLGLGKRQILIAEDALHSILTAKKAGFFTVGVYDPATPFEEWQQICSNATISVKKLIDILKLI